MALADFFVQPGVPDAFNDYRFPSKLPEFFAIGPSGTPPLRANLGLTLRHGIDAYVLDRADAERDRGRNSRLKKRSRFGRTAGEGSDRIFGRAFQLAAYGGGACQILWCPDSLGIHAPT